MTIEQIFSRYEIDKDVINKALEQGAFIKFLQANWVGHDLDWQVLKRAALFYDLGDTEKTALVRKKVGIDKYIVNIISRSVEKRSQEIIDGGDWYQKILLLSILIRYSTTSNFVSQLVNQIEEFVIHPIPLSSQSVSKEMRIALLSLDIKHYKNPSV